MLNVQLQLFVWGKKLTGLFDQHIPWKDDWVLSTNTNILAKCSGKPISLFYS